MNFYVVLLLVSCALLNGSWVAAATAEIHLNQLGFLPEDSKIAVVPNNQSGEFWLISAATNSEVLRGPLSQATLWGEAQKTVKIADFSAFNKSGDYYLSVNGVGKSQVFTIADKRYDKALFTVANTFYLHRAGSAVETRLAGAFARPAGHPDLMVYRLDNGRPDGEAFKHIYTSARGWYDSGDYNKYAVNSALTVYFLLQAYQSQRDYFNTLSLNIPESYNALPDIVDEALWGIDWLLTMQDGDGGVFQRLAAKDYGVTGLPSEQQDPRFLMPKNTAATLHFAAVMAYASRIIKDFDGDKAAILQRAAERAWSWAKAHPQVIFAQPPGVRSQLYAWTNDQLHDEWLWAAAELSATSGKRTYLKGLDIPEKITALQWQNLEVPALLALAELSKLPLSQSKTIQQVLVKYADETVQQFWRSGYLVPLGKDDFTRGSNFIAMNKAFTLIAIDQLFPRVEYRDGARALLDYVFGRNPLGVSFVTGLGTNQVLNPRDWISQYDKVKQPLPGLVVAGPYALADEKCVYQGSAPALRYADLWCSEMTNQVSLAGSAALVYVLAHLRESSALKSRR